MLTHPLAVLAASVLSVLLRPSPSFSALSAQTIPAAGAVLKADSTPVPGARVVLHQVGRALQGPLDSTRTDRRGRFRFAFRPDTSALYLLSARHAGIEYFSPPVHTNPERPDTAIRVIVYDTSSTAPVSLEARHLVVTRPGEDGSRSVLDLMVLLNGGQRTRVAPDSAGASWGGLLPRGTTGPRAGRERRLTRRGSPARRLAHRSRTAGSGREAAHRPVRRFPRASKDLELRFTEPVSIGQRPGRGKRRRGERRQSGAGGQPGAPGTLLPPLDRCRPGRWHAARRAPGRAGVPEWLLPSLVAAIVARARGAGWYFLVRQARARRAPPRPSCSTPSPRSMRATWGGRRKPPSTEWASYQTERRRLKAQLEAALAAGGARANRLAAAEQLKTTRTGILGSRCKSGAAPPL